MTPDPVLEQGREMVVQVFAACILLGAILAGMFAGELLRQLRMVLDASLSIVIGVTWDLYQVVCGLIVRTLRMRRQNQTLHGGRALGRE